MVEADFISTVEKATGLTVVAVGTRSNLMDRTGMSWNQYTFNKDNTTLVLRYNFARNKLMFCSYSMNGLSCPATELRKHGWDDTTIFYSPRKDKNDKGVWTTHSDYEHFRFGDKLYWGAFGDTRDDLYSLHNVIENMVTYLKKCFDSNKKRVMKAESKTEKMQALVEAENDKIQKFMTLKAKSFLAELNEDFYDACPSMEEDGWRFIWNNESNIKCTKIKHVEEIQEFKLSFALQRFDGDASKEYSSVFNQRLRFMHEMDGNMKAIQDDYGYFTNLYELDCSVPKAPLELPNPHNRPANVEMRIRSTLEPYFSKIRKFTDLEERNEYCCELRRHAFKILEKAYDIRKQTELAMKKAMDEFTEEFNTKE